MALSKSPSLAISTTEVEISHEPRREKRKADQEIDEERKVIRRRLDLNYHVERAELDKIVGIDLCDEPERNHEAKKVLHDITSLLGDWKYDTPSENDIGAIMKYASQLMSSHNARQLLKFLEAESGNDNFWRPGYATVCAPTLLPEDVIADELENRWPSWLRSSVASLFDCGHFKAPMGDDEEVEHGFLGLVVNTVASAMVFRFLFNVILKWTHGMTSTSDLADLVREGYAQRVDNLQLRIREQELQQATDWFTKRKSRTGAIVPWRWQDATSLLRFRDCAEEICSSHSRASIDSVRDMAMTNVKAFISHPWW